MKDKALFGILVLFWAGMTSGLGQTTPPPPPAPLITSKSLPPSFLGEVQNREYINRFFGFKITIPAELSILSREELDALYAAGGDMLKSKDESGTGDLENSLNKTIPLFAVAKFRPEPSSNSALEITVTQQSDGVTSNMALAETIEMMRAMGTYEFKQSFAEVRLGPWTFRGAELKTSAFGPELKHRMYVTMRNGFALFVSITYIQPEDLARYDAILNSITRISR
jgi:hypothetical protein